MRYRAVAVASERSNAVGSLELECTAHGLFVAYLGVGAFSEGYAPAALTAGTGLTVPWSEVQEASVEGDQILIAIDHKLTPLNRLLLMHFTTGHGPPPEELAKRRLLVRFAAIAAALVVALLLAASLLRGSPETSAAAAICLAALAAGVLLAIGFVVDRNLASNSDEPAVLASFSMDLGHYLPTLVRLPRAPSSARPLPTVSELQGLLPRTTLAIVISLTAGILGVLLVARWVTTSEGAVGRVTSQLLEPAPVALPPQALPALPATPSVPVASAPPPAEPALPSGVALGDACRCARSDSLLWAEPIPKLSLLILSQRLRQGRGPDENRRKTYSELDLAVVNNSNQELEEVALLVLFYERDPAPSSKRTQVDNRPLFFEGPLLPGQAIKWSVEAEGAEFEIQNPVSGDIGPNGEHAAPAQRVAELLNARNRAVRLHGAMLLAFLGDARAKEGALALREALRDDEAPYLTRLLQALSEVRVCQLRFADEGRARRVSACLHNIGKQPQSELGLKLRGLERAVSSHSPSAEPPAVVFEASYRISGELGADAGRSVRLTFDSGAQRLEVAEAWADRYDLVR